MPPTKVERKPLELVVKDVDTYYATDYELYGTGRISHAPMAFDTFIVGAEDENIQRFLDEGKIVYINKGMRQNVSPGQRWHPALSRRDSQPGHQRLRGILLQELGTVKVLIAHDDKAIAQIDLAARAVHIGDALVPFRKLRKLFATKPTNRSASSKITGKLPATSSSRTA